VYRIGTRARERTCPDPRPYDASWASRRRGVRALEMLAALGASRAPHAPHRRQGPEIEPETQLDDEGRVDVDFSVKAPPAK